MRHATIALVLMVLPTAALAQDLAPLDELKACRLDPGSISLAFIYEGGACEQTGDAEVAHVDGDTVAITVPTLATAEICTMQLVKVNFAGLVTVPETATRIDVQVLNPTGEVVAAGDGDITPNTPDCLPPEAQVPAAQ